MRGRLALLALALCLQGCGRLGFDRPEDASSGDAVAPADAADARALVGPSDGLVAAFPLDDDPSDGVRELTGSGARARCSPCPVLEAGAYRFSGTEWVEVEPDPAFETTSSFTLSLWTRPGRAGAIQTMVSKVYGSASLNSWQLSHRPGGGCGAQHFQLETAVPAGSYEQLNGPDGPVVDGWWHVAATWDGSEKRLFVNGERVGSDGGGVLFDGGTIRIGTDWDGGAPNHTFVGDLRDFRLYDRALDAAEIDALLATGTVVPPPGGGAPGAVNVFVLVDAASDADLGTLTEGTAVTVPAGGINVRAEVSGVAGSVRFDLDGMVGYRVESTTPFALEGDTDGDYDPWRPAPGAHTLGATPFCGSGATGEAGARLTVGFDVR